MTAPMRSFRLTLMIDADSRDELVQQLECLAILADKNELTTGASGSHGSGYTYELLYDPRQTHEKYFSELRSYLAKGQEK